MVSVKSQFAIHDIQSVYTRYNRTKLLDTGFHYDRKVYKVHSLAAGLQWTYESVINFD